MFNIGPEELILILVIALIFLGPAKLPEVARSLGKGLREFRSLSGRAQGELMRNLSLHEEDDSAIACREAAWARPDRVRHGTARRSGPNAQVVQRRGAHANRSLRPWSAVTTSLATGARKAAEIGIVR